MNTIGYGFPQMLPRPPISALLMPSSSAAQRMGQGQPPLGQGQGPQGAQGIGQGPHGRPPLGQGPQGPGQGPHGIGQGPQGPPPLGQGPQGNHGLPPVHKRLPLALHGDLNTLGGLVDQFNA